jgi:hypothetical protein
MHIQQAIFTSADRGQIKGYQLVAKSDNIDRNISRELCRWSPSHMGNDDPGNWTINYFPVSDELVAVARTVLGGPEYSGRGGSQLVTITAVLQNEQFAAYENNAMSVAQTAVALGWLRLPLQMPSRLPAITLPESPLGGQPEYQGFLEEQSGECSSLIWGAPREELFEKLTDSSLPTGIIDLLNQGKRFAIIGARSPAEMVEKLISELPIQARRDFSFTTGLPPALHRPFQAHFLPYSNPILSQMLKSEGVTVVHAPPNASRAC